MHCLTFIFSGIVSRGRFHSRGAFGETIIRQGWLLHNGAIIWIRKIPYSETKISVNILSAYLLGPSSNIQDITVNSSPTPNELPAQHNPHMSLPPGRRKLNLAIHPPSAPFGPSLTPSRYTFASPVHILPSFRILINLRLKSRQTHNPEKLLYHSRPEHGHQVPSHPPIAATRLVP